ncbi:MAG TPA: AMP-binding protein [Rhizomicrobium sp.]|jgi:acyl-CoA synthetase (AMP-forming)/AMP-acid ligase II
MIDDLPRHIHELVPYQVARDATRPALVDAGRSWSYGELDAAISTTASWLQHSGVRRGDRVMLVCENAASTVALLFATACLGAWPVIVNARLADPEIDAIRAHCGARIVVFTSGASARAKAHGERLGAVAFALDSIGTISATRMDDAASIEQGEHDRTRDVAALIYTSGTTGKPKGVMLSHASLLFVARATARARELNDDDRVYAVLPLSHILGLTGVLLGAFASGACVHLTARFDPAAALAALSRERVSVMIGTPSMYALLAEYSGRKGLAPIPAPALRLISSAGAPLDMATKAAAEKAFGRVLHNGYGITECGPSLTLTRLDAPRRDCGIGVVLPGIGVRLKGADGSDVAAGEVGELHVRTPGLMNGYYKAPEETASVIDGEGWFRTGDLARFDDESLFIVGRSKELIIRFGFNVYPAEIEGVLNAHPAVARAAVIGRAANDSEDILAFVSLAAGAQASVAQLQDFAASRLAPYKRPQQIVVLAELPTSAAGKILKSELAALIPEAA